MTKEKTDALYRKYPEIFREHTLPMTETCMCWDFECGDGWYGIIDALCCRLMLIKEQRGVRTVATQVKEKFGTLRFYFKLEMSIDKPVDGLEKINERIHSLVNSFELMSGHVCEQCGTTLNVNTHTIGGWISTLCDSCAEEKRKHRTETDAR